LTLERLFSLTRQHSLFSQQSSSEQSSVSVYCSLFRDSALNALRDSIFLDSAVNSVWILFNNTRISSDTHIFSDARIRFDARNRETTIFIFATVKSAASVFDDNAFNIKLSSFHDKDDENIVT
jgi:hypothetical protein